MLNIGIFWFFRGKLFGRTVRFSEGEESCPGLLDSSSNHSDVWEEDRTLLADFPELKGKEYFNIPRGRVLWNKAENHAIVYMDSTLFSDRCKEMIVDFFNLHGREVNWKRDIHYTTSPEDLAAIFDTERVVR